MKRNSIMALAAASALVAVGARAEQPRIYGYQNIKQALQRRGRSYRSGGYPANINRHTGNPHENRREMARRVRQMSRAA